MRASLKAQRKSRVSQAHAVARRVDTLRRNRSSSRNGTRGEQIQRAYVKLLRPAAESAARTAVRCAVRSFPREEYAIHAMDRSARENLGVTRWPDSVKPREAGRLPDEAQRPTTTSALCTLTDNDGESELIGDDAAGGDGDT